MNAEQLQNLKRVLAKLSALRATLSDDEQNILDQFIVESGSEVIAHKIPEGKIPEGKIPEGKIPEMKIPKAGCPMPMK